MALSPLLPIRHKQGDMFIAEIFDNLPFKSDIAGMEHPLFTLNPKTDMRILRYESDDGKASVEMQPSAFGLPNIMDKDILLYCASVIMAKINEGEIPPKTIRLSMRDVLIATNRHANKDGYIYIKRALNRLTGCMLKTSIKTGRIAQEDGFHLIERFRFLESERVKGRLIGAEVTLSDWFYNSLIAKEVLTLNKNYFTLRSGLSRRLYEIARKKCGYQSEYKTGLKKLHIRTGSTARLSHFRDTIKRFIEAQEKEGAILPDYLLSFDSKTDKVIFHYRGATAVIEEEQGDLFASSSLPESIPPDLLEDVKKVVGDGLDYYQLWYEFRNWKGSRTAKNPRGAFIGFCGKKAAKAVMF